MSAPSPSPAAQLLQEGEVRVVVGQRPWVQRPVGRMVKTLGVFALGAGLATVVAVSVSPHRNPVHQTEAAAPLVEPRAAPLAGTGAVEDARTTAASVNPATVNPPAASASIDANLAATLDRVAQAADPNTIPNLLLAEQRPFLALAARLESFQSHAYFDSGGLNVGYGYCVSKRNGEAGAARVRQDLTEAGFPAKDIEVLLSGARQEQEGVAVSPHQALRLLAIAQGEYIEAARNTVGPSTFDALPAHRQAALSWLTYNTGAGGFAQFHNLIEAVRTDRPLDAVQHITPRFVDSSGTRVVNARAGTALMAAYWSDAGLHMAVEHLETLTASAKKGASPLLAVDPQLKADRKHGLPASPYLMSPGTVDIATLAARYTAAGSGLSVDAAQYSGKEPVIASKGFGFDDKSMAIWRAMKAKQAAGASAAPNRPKPR